MADAPSPHGLRRLTWAVAVVALASATYAAWAQGWTYDEPVHLLWSRRLLETGLAERDSQERFNSKTPVTIPNVLAEKAARGLGLPDDVVRFAARLPTLAWLAVLLLATGLVGRRLFGEEAGCLAVLAVALDPNVLAHGSLATVDVAYA